jgi:hypothetical protein
MALETSNSLNSATASAEEPVSRRTWLVSMTSFLFIVLQSACTAVIAISGVRVAIGLSALGAATFGIHAPAHGFHRDVIRIPMMMAASVGSLINLYVIWRIRTLRARPASQWRVQAVSLKQASIRTLSDWAFHHLPGSGGCGVDHSFDGAPGSVEAGRHG